MKKSGYMIMYLLFAIVLFSGCTRNYDEMEPDAISSTSTNLDEELIVIANRNYINDKEEFAKLIIQKCKDNSFRSIKLSTDYGYATSLKIKVYLSESKLENHDLEMTVDYRPIEVGVGYDIIHNPEKFQTYIDGKLIAHE